MGHNTNKLTIKTSTVYLQLQKYIVLKYKKQLSVTSDYDCVLAMLFGSSRNGTLDVTQFSVATIFETAGAIRRDALYNTCPMCKGQRWIINMFTILLWYTGPPNLGINSKTQHLWSEKLAEGFLPIQHS